MPLLLRRPPTVTVAGILLLGESVLVVVKGMWAANMGEHDAQLSRLLVRVVVAPIIMAIVGKLILSGFRVSRYAYWLVVAGLIWLLKTGESDLKSWGAVAVDLYVGILLFMPKASAFFAGRDYRRIGMPEPEYVEPEEETKYTIAPRTSPRGGGPAA
jgi:hypothetical protein